MLQSTLKQNLAYLALERGVDQSDIVRTALEDYMKKEKIDPTKPPKVSFRSPDWILVNFHRASISNVEALYLRSDDARRALAAKEYRSSYL